MRFCPATWICLLFLLLAESALGAAPVRGTFFEGRQYRRIDDLAALCGMQWRISGKNCLLSGRNRPTMVFVNNRREMLFGGMHFVLCDAPHWRGGGFYVSNTDWLKSLRPLIYPGTAPNHRIRTVFLDCGHGGVDQGAPGRRSLEKRLTLQLGLRTAAKLRAAGFQVKMTRSSDKTVPLQQRSAIANNSRSDLFVSIHINASTDRSIRGIETFCLTPAGAASSGDSKPRFLRFAGNSRDSSNLLLAYLMQKSLLRQTRAADRGLKRARFAVLKDLYMPGVLVEVGFISNAAEEYNLNTPAYQDKIASGIVEGILAYRRQIGSAGK